MTGDRYTAALPDVDAYRRMVRCQAACPALTDGRAYVTAIAAGELALGYQAARDPNPLSTICGRICAAPCETACRRGAVGPDFQPVAIRALKRSLTERFGPESDQDLDSSKDLTGFINLSGLDKQSFSPARWSLENLRRLAQTPGRRSARVAVVGGGPSGLTAAHDLVLLGHDVTIFEAGPRPGGLALSGAPRYRVDLQAVEKEVKAILALGVRMECNTALGREISLAELRREYEAVYLGIGLGLGRRLEIEGAHLEGVFTALELLAAYNQGGSPRLGSRVVVVGGGDVAMDVGRTALRLGAEQVRIAALEAWEALPTAPVEIRQALEEGLTIFPGLGPSRILGGDGSEAGRVAGLELMGVETLFEDGGLFKPSYHPGSQQTWACESVILAVGQTADLQALQETWGELRIDGRGLVQTDPESGRTSLPDVFAGGDVAHGPRLIIDAVRDGHLAALSIEEKIQGRRLELQVQTQWREIPLVDLAQDGRSDGWLKLERREPPALPLDGRRSHAVVEQSYAPGQAEEQARRCLECSVNTIFDGTKCILCGGCVDVCPWDCLKIVGLDDLQGEAALDQLVLAARREGATAAMLKDETACTRCAQCARRCPTGAITMEAFRFAENLLYA